MSRKRDDSHMHLDVHDVPPNTISSLLSVSIALSSSLELDIVLQAAIESACELLGLETGAIYIVIDGRMRLGATTPPLEPDFPEEFRFLDLDEHPHVHQALTSKRPVYLPDTLTARLTEAERTVSVARSLRSLLYLPLVLEDESVGTMILGTTQEIREFDHASIALASIFAAQATAAVVNARLHESERRANEEVRTVNENLERLIDERTRELASANEELRAQAEELQRQALELEERTLELEEANDSKARFLRSMSHELRTPLNSIIGFSGMLLQGLAGELSDEQRRQLEMVSRAGKHLLAIMNDLLDLCRIDSGALRVSVGPIDIEGLVNECVHTVAPSIGEKDLSISMSLPDSCPDMVSDAVRLRQILLNLLDNAVKFTQAGSVRIEVDCPDSETFRFTVNDTGPGIPADKLEAIFGEFEQVLAKRDRTVEGTGLGLAVSRGLAIALGGAITAESRIGSGSRFTLTLPRVIDPVITADSSA